MDVQNYRRDSMQRMTSKLEHFSEELAEDMKLLYEVMAGMQQ